MATLREQLTYDTWDKSSSKLSWHGILAKNVPLFAENVLKDLPGMTADMLDTLKHVNWLDPSIPDQFVNDESLSVNAQEENEGCRAAVGFHQDSKGDFSCLYILVKIKFKVSCVAVTGTATGKGTTSTVQPDSSESCDSENTQESSLSTLATYSSKYIEPVSVFSRLPIVGPFIGFLGFLGNYWEAGNDPSEQCTASTSSLGESAASSISTDGQAECKRAKTSDEDGGACRLAESSSESEAHAPAVPEQAGQSVFIPEQQGEQQAGAGSTTSELEGHQEQQKKHGSETDAEKKEPIEMSNSEQMLEADPSRASMGKADEQHGSDMWSGKASVHESRGKQQHQQQPANSLGPAEDVREKANEEVTRVLLEIFTDEGFQC